METVVCPDCNLIIRTSDKEHECAACVAAEQEALNYDEGKNPLHLLPTEALEAVATVLAKNTIAGGGKYPPHNWRSGMKYSRCSSSLLRHMFAFLRGEDYDDESNLLHIAHVAVRALFLLQYQLDDLAHFDDRYKETK